MASTSLSASPACTENEKNIFSSAMDNNGSFGNKTTTPSINSNYDSFAHLRIIADYIYIFSSSIITILGIVGNSLTLAIMTRRSFRYTSVAVYLSAMAISDSLALIMDDLNNWFKTVPKINLLALSNGFCRFHRFFFNVVFTYSAWIVTSVCIERFIVVWFPFRAKQICSYRNTVIAVTTMPLPICAIYIYNLWAWYSDGTSCLVASNWSRFQADIGPWISGLSYSYFPVIVMVILNAGIIGKLSMARDRRRQMSTDAVANEKRETRVTITIVVICVSYVIMTVPLSIYYTLAFKYGEFTTINSKFYIVRAVVIMISTSSYATNFFLYVLTSAAFRKQLRQILCCFCGHQPTRGDRSVSTGFSGVVTGGGGGGGKAAAHGGSSISLAISSISATRVTDVTDDGRSVTASEPNASTTPENTRF